MHVYTTFGHCTDYPNECIARCAGNNMYHGGECIKLNKDITEICPCSDNIIKTVHFINKHSKCKEFSNSCFAECAGITKFVIGKCPH